MTRSLYHLTQDHQQLRDIAEHFTDADDNDVLAEAFDQLQGEIADKMDGCCAIIKEWEHHAEALKAEAERLTTARKQYEARIVRLKQMMVKAMQETDTKKIDGERFKVTRVPGKDSVEITGDVPADFIRTEVVEKIDKQFIAQRLKAGEELAFAKFVRGDDSLRIR